MFVTETLLVNLSTATTDPVRGKHSSTQPILLEFPLRVLTLIQEFAQAQAEPMVSARGGTLPAHGQSELHLAVITGRAHEVTKLLKRPDRKRIIDAQDDDGTTPLMAAVLTGRLRIVKLILKAGASMRIRDRRGLNPRHYNRPSLFARKLELYRRLGMPPATSKQKKERLGILKLLRFPAALESW